MKRQKRKRHTDAAVTSGLRIKMTVDFGEEGVPLERFDEVMKALKEARLDVGSKASRGFVPISFDRYVSLHVKSNPTVDKTEYALRLRRAVDARKAGARCACGAPIWAIGSAEVGDACFACITGEAWPEDDYEIDEVLGL
jgi:hypothetical protein